MGDAFKGVKTIAEIAQKHKLHGTQINLRKEQLLEGAEDVFLDGKGMTPEPIARWQDNCERIQSSSLKMSEQLNTN